MKVWWLLVLLTACAFDPAIVRNASIRRAAGGMLWACIQNNPMDRNGCRAENYAWCLSQGLEKTCGIDDAWDLSFRNKIRK